MGRVATVTSYADVAGTSPVNQVEYVYNGWGTVDSEYQEPNGVGRYHHVGLRTVRLRRRLVHRPEGGHGRKLPALDLVWYPANPNGGGSNFVNYLYSLDPATARSTT